MALPVGEETLLVTTGLPATNIKLVPVVYSDSITENLLKYPTTDCNRCKRKFAQMGPKPFKMCEHCRTLQRQRSRRWQRRTKQKEGVCTRCGSDFPDGATNYALCQHCRDVLRSTKANRHLEGKCVHCSGPNDEEGAYKVCRRCREKDKLRRLSLETSGLCNRCTEKIPKDQKGHKICQSCRLKKRKNGLSLGSEPPITTDRTIIRDIEVGRLYSDDIKSKVKSIQQNIKSRAIAQYNTDIQNLSHNNKRVKVIASKNEIVCKITEKVKLPIPAPKPTAVDKENDNITTTNEDIKTTSAPPSNKIRNNDHMDTAIQEESSVLNVDTVNDTDESIKRILEENNDTEYKRRKVFFKDVSTIDAELDIDDEKITDNLVSYHDHIHDPSKSLNENDILSETFNMPHDHSQLNQQLKQLGQLTSHSSDEEEDEEEDDDEDEDIDDDTESVLVDLDGLEAIGMEYNMDDVDGDPSVVGDGNVEYEEEKETMLRHVRAVQAGLLSNTTEPSDAEMAAAVEAVAVAAAVAQSRNEENEKN